MKAIKQYGWVLQIIGAALLIGLALFLEFSNGEDIVVVFIGSLIILSALIRLVPYVKTQKSDLIKTINIIEITIDVALGLALILIQLLIEEDMGTLFGKFIGIYLVLRGSVHFFGVSEQKEKSDLALYFFHVAAISLGSVVFFWKQFDAVLLIHLILAFSVISGGYLSFSGYKGYSSYRRQKTLIMPDIAQDDKVVEKRVPTSPTAEPEVGENAPLQDHVS